MSILLGSTNYGVSSHKTSSPASQPLTAQASAFNVQRLIANAVSARLSAGPRSAESAIDSNHPRALPQTAVSTFLLARALYTLGAVSIQDSQNGYPKKLGGELCTCQARKPMYAANNDCGFRRRQAARLDFRVDEKSESGERKHLKRAGYGNGLGYGAKRRI